MKRRHMFKIFSAWLASATVPLSAVAAVFPLKKPTAEWPSFFQALPDALGTSTDYKLIYPRTEYHCSRCGGTTAMCSMTGPDPRASAFATTVWLWRSCLKAKPSPH